MGTARPKSRRSCSTSGNSLVRTSHCDYLHELSSTRRSRRYGNLAGIEHAAALPHAPHHRRQASSQIATRDAGRTSFIQPPLVWVGENILLGRDRRLGRAEDDIFQGIAASPRRSQPVGTVAALTPFQPDPKVFPQLLLALEPKRRVDERQECRRPYPVHSRQI